MTQLIVAASVGLLGLHMLRAALHHRALAEAWLLVGAASLVVATTSGYAFTYTVFRRGETWARVIVIAGTLLVLWGAWTQVSGPNGTPDLTGMRVEFLIGRFACFAWGTYEAVRAYGMARRRLLVGLADPVVVNRFALFGIWFAVMGVMPLTLALTRMSGGAAAQATANGLGPKLIGSVMIIALMLMTFHQAAPESAESAFARFGGGSRAKNP